MIKIIKPGTRIVKTCNVCGCEFSYEAEDIIRKEIEDFSTNYMNEYVPCPQCKTELLIKEAK